MRPNAKLHALLAVALTVTAATGATAGGYLKLGGVKGDASKGGKFEGQLEVESWSWGASQSTAHGSGGGGGAGKVNVHDISISKQTDVAAGKDGAKGGNVEFEWKVEEGESAPPPPGGVSVAAGDVTGDGTAAPRKPTTPPQTISPRPLPGSETGAASGLPTGKRQHKPFTITKPLDKGSVWVRVSSPWAGCRVGARYPSLELGSGAKRYVLQDVTVASCGSAADDRPTEEVSFYYNKIAFNY